MKNKIHQWFSSEDGIRYRLERQNDLAWQHPTKGDCKIHVDPSVRYQPILGFGSSMEEATVYNLRQLPPADQDRILRCLFDPGEGIGWNLLRICFGSSDFTGQPYYSYNDLPPGETDPDLTRFSIQKDVDYGIVDFIRKALSINPSIRIVASPWSPPAWMKESGTLAGGSLLPHYYEVAAAYYRKAIQAYEELGIPIYAFTVQNEPLMDNPTYPTCYFTWPELRDFLKIVHAEFSSHHLSTRLWPVDHNFNMAMSYAGKILNDPEAARCVEGISFHDYLDEPSEMTALHAIHPEKNLYITERSVWGTAGIDRILQYLRNHAQCHISWVTCLDDHRQPNQGCHFADPTFIKRESSLGNGWSVIPEYYLHGQISTFVQRGACRIESNYGSRGYVTNAAFLNPDQSIALVVVNQKPTDQTIEVEVDSRQFSTTVPKKTVATYTWKQE